MWNSLPHWSHLTGLVLDRRAWPHLVLAASSSAIESPEDTRSVRLGVGGGSAKGRSITFVWAVGLCFLHSQTFSNQPLALLIPVVCGIRCMLVVYELVSGSLPYDIGKLPSAV